MVPVEIGFLRIPTLREVFRYRLWRVAILSDYLLWGPGLVCSGRWHHVFFRYDNKDYHVSSRSARNGATWVQDSPRELVYQVWVPEENVARAVNHVNLCNSLPWWKLLRSNCTHGISLLLYGRHDRYSTWFGIGLFTRRVLGDVELVALCHAKPLELKSP